jgi:hypothetical protein
MTAAYQLRISLKEANPPIWRSILVPAQFTLAQLHQVIQIAMGWGDSQVHLFEIGGRFYGSTQFDRRAGGPVNLDERRFKLRNVFIFERQRGRYTYDFREDWEHELFVERLVQFRPTPPLPTCISGQRACPPEDCGGIWGYAMVCEAIAHPDESQLAEFAAWIEPGFDPEKFDCSKVNHQLARTFPEDMSQPSDSSSQQMGPWA